jgi:hypothetical protein
MAQHTLVLLFQIHNIRWLLFHMDCQKFNLELIDVLKLV